MTGNPVTIPPKNGEAQIASAAPVNVYTRFNKQLTEDMRVRIRVPGSYITDSTIGSLNLKQFENGIVFPYTPVITYTQKADYQSTPAVHTNYTQFFYKSSGLTEINIEARFTVQNSEEAKAYLSLRHLLSALTKIPFGDDVGAGAPPPICRLDAYGSYMIKDVPIVISNFKVTLPNDVDYFGIFADGRQYTYNVNTDIDGRAYEVSYDESQRSTSGQNMVPVLSTFSIACLPLYSRTEMLQFSLKNFLEDYNNNTKYL